MTTVEIEPFLKPAQVAKQLNISITQVHRLFHSGEIPHIRLGKQTIRVRPEDLDHYIQENLKGQEESGGQTSPR